ncbi:MAG TPA: nuclear transport factor 2 family protein [Solirubrobacterales bacterium]|nr:nuclear transport factor 2 family protein [Solirubrobacterales bacterium]
MAEPIEVFERHLAAFNRHDLEAFLASYADDVSINGLPVGSVEGIAAVRSLYSERFEDRTLRCEVREAVELGGRWVVAHEVIHSSAGVVEFAGIFEIADGLIRRADMSARYPLDDDR